MYHKGAYSRRLVIMPMCAKSSSPGDSCGCVPLSLFCGKGTRVMSSSTSVQMLAHSRVLAQ